MSVSRARAIAVMASTLLAQPLMSHAGPAATVLPVSDLTAGKVGASPVANAAFHPGADALPATAFAAALHLQSSRLQSLPAIEHPEQKNRDARLFPAVTFEVFTLDDLLVPVQRGAMIAEPATQAVRSYWRVIPQIGRVWREKADGNWSRAALPLILVNDVENHAHQGLATFLYRGNEVTGLTVQFVQQTAPYLLGRHFVSWGHVPMQTTGLDPASLPAERASAQAELAARLPAKPWSELAKMFGEEKLQGFGGPLYRQWQVELALVHDGTLFFQDSSTPYGPYPYPLEMRFGVRSVMKSVGAPLALLHLAQVYGPWVLTLKIGDYVHGLDPKWSRVRFLDAADMASGFGGTGSLKTQPNDIYDGYLEGNYDAWYTAPSLAEKLAQINANLGPYPWEPGTVMRYRDQDFFLLGAAIDAFLKSMRGPEADIWDMLQAEVFRPIGIQHAPAVRTQEAAGRDGLVWCNAGYYPTLDDLAKIAMLYRDHGAHQGAQILHRELTAELLAARDAMQKDGDFSVSRVSPESAGPKTEFYKMGFHFLPFVATRGHRLLHLPTMSGSGENQVILYPNRMISIVIAKAAQLPPGEQAKSDDIQQTIRVVEKLAPF